MSVKNILILGACGFIGQNLVKTLLPLGVNLHVLDQFDTTQVFHSDVALFHTGLSLEQTDSLLSYINYHNIDTIIHLVSGILPSSTASEFSQEQITVISPTFDLINGIKDNPNIKFIYFSSGGTVYGKQDSIYFHEDMCCKPVTYYGLSKLIIENYIQTTASLCQLDFIIIRPSNPYGPFQNIYGRQGFIAVAIGKLLHGDSIQIWGDGQIIRDYIFIDDLCDAVVSVINKQVSNLIVNIGSGIGTSLIDVVDAIKKSKLISKIDIDFLPARNVDVAGVVLCTERIRSYVDYNVTPLSEGIASFIQYVREHQCHE